MEQLQENKETYLEQRDISRKMEQLQEGAKCRRDKERWNSYSVSFEFLQPGGEKTVPPIIAALQKGHNVQMARIIT